MNVIIVGEGSFGKAIFSVVAKNCNNVAFYRNGQALEADVIILTVPAQSLRSVYQTIGQSDAIIVNCAKGIEQKTHLLPFQIAEDVLGKTSHYTTLMGPSFAQEVIDEMPTLVNLGYRKGNEAVSRVKELFQTNYFRVLVTRSLEAVELAGAFKNVYAIGCGIASGLGFGTNTRVKLMMVALDEITVLAKKLGFPVDKDADPGIIGDLVLSCSSTESRNFRFGKLLTQYRALESLEKLSTTVEGYTTVDSVSYFAKKTRLALPLATCITRIVHANDPISVKKKFAEFVKRV